MIEMAVEGVPVGGRQAGRGGGRGFAGQSTPIPPQEAAQVSSKWPEGSVDLRMANYMLQAQQKWTIAPVPGTGGYPGSPYFKITIAGTDRTLSAAASAELVVLPQFTGEPEQLWRFDQLADGSWRIMPKSVPGTKDSLALSAVGSSFATPGQFDPASEKQRWLVKAR